LQVSKTGPFLFVVDPESEGETLPREEIPAFVRAIAREHVAGLFRGLRLFELASSLSYAGGPFAEATLLISDSTVSPTSVSVPALHGITATGRLFRPGPGDLSPTMIGEDIFIGVQDEIIEDLRSDSENLPVIVEPQSLSSEGVVRGADGLIVARPSSVTIIT